MSEKEKRSVWVIGHKNPDTDSICAAIAYAHLKNQTDEGDFIPKKAGQINGETAYVLDRFHVEEPETVEDVGTQVRDLAIRKTAGISGHYSLKKAWELMNKIDVATLPIVSANNLLEGLIVKGDLAYSYMDVYDNRILGRARTKYKHIMETLKGEILTGNSHGCFVKGKVVVASGSRSNIQQEIEEDDLVILGNVKERQLIALEKNPSCIIVTGVNCIDQEVVEAAAKIDCVLITTEYDTFTAARLINQSMPVRHFMTKENIISFELDDFVDDVKDTMSKIRHRDFPVLDDKRHYIGMFSRRNMIDVQKKNIILVDHNEKTQAVNGIDEAEILEIIDHHRLGSLETIQPIFFRNQPLGCSSTIIYQMYCEKEVAIEPKIAGILLSAILSDTLMFRSPTCTPVDVEAGKALAKIVGVDYKELAIAMFEAGSNFKGKTTEEIFYQDFKKFSAEDVDFGVAQISAVSEKQLAEITPALTEYMQTVLGDKHLDMVFILLTNILEQGSVLLYTGEMADETAIRAFGAQKKQGETFVLPGVVSRKKQFIPAIIDALQKNA